MVCPSCPDEHEINSVAQLPTPCCMDAAFITEALCNRLLVTACVHPQQPATLELALACCSVICSGRVCGSAAELRHRSEPTAKLPHALLSKLVGVVAAPATLVLLLLLSSSLSSPPPPPPSSPPPPSCHRRRRPLLLLLPPLPPSLCANVYDAVAFTRPDMCIDL